MTQSKSFSYPRQSLDGLVEALERLSEHVNHLHDGANVASEAAHAIRELREQKEYLEWCLLRKPCYSHLPPVPIDAWRDLKAKGLL